MSMWILWLGSAAAVGVSALCDARRTRQAVVLGWRALLGIMPSLLAVVGLLGLVMALASPQALTRLLTTSGPAGFALVVAVGSVITIPAPVAFPLAGSLLRLGASPAALAAFITTLTMVGLVTAPLESSYFGRRFTVVRQGLSFALAVVIGGLMGVLL